MSMQVNAKHIRSFHDLMPHRIREVLLVSSPYDAFILEEDGNLTERIFDEYSELNLSSAPRVTHVDSAERALELMKLRRFDLVLSMMRLSDMDVSEFGRKVKKRYPMRPVVLLAFDNPDLELVAKVVDKRAIDRVFMWNGDAKILLAIIKFFEDLNNVDHDISKADVQVIIVVEDSVRFYSAFIGMLYAELMKQAQSLYAEGVNRLYKLLRMRSRPKILLATDYEEAMGFFKKYQNNLLAVISDLGFEKGGVRVPGAGLELARNIRKYTTEIPMLLQSAQESWREQSEALAALFLNKRSPRLLGAIRDFLRDYLGFGPFIFRLPNGDEVGRAHDVRELERVLAHVPGESIRFHGQSDHISIWLMARSEYSLAKELRRTKISDFDNIEAVRKWVIKRLKAERKKKRHGVIAEYRRSRLEPENRFIRIGDGSIGGKARGLAFINYLLDPVTFQDKYENLQVLVPQTLVVCTDYFDRFMTDNGLYDIAYSDCPSADIISAFLEASLPDDLVEELRFILTIFTFPLAVRSSSLLEDSQYQPFAGIYETYMLPNCHDDPDMRLTELKRAIKLVYASTFSDNAKAYINNTARRIEDEKMAVVLQQVVGQEYDKRYYPTFSGVAQSHNYYPIGHQSAEDGVVMVALGLGRMVVDGGQALRFCPKYPQVLPQYSSATDVWKNSQKGFWAIGMCKPFVDDAANDQTTLGYYELEDAEGDGTLKVAGGVYSQGDDQIRDSLDEAGPRVITFNNILKYNIIPLPEALSEILERCRTGMGTEVELEFACDMGDWGRRVEEGCEKALPTLTILQLRPIVNESFIENQIDHDYEDNLCVCKSEMTLGHGQFDEIKDVVYVKREIFDPKDSKAIAREIGMVNKSFNDVEDNYILIGPGRWGSSDPWLGIPVQWAQISHAKIMVEASPKGYNVDPSQGTHFFQNITSLRIGYMTVPPGALPGANEQFVDWDYLDSLTEVYDGDFLRHVRVKEPFAVLLDGRDGSGVITKPGVVKEPFSDDDLPK